jgi:hypothetical protein
MNKKLKTIGLSVGLAVSIMSFSQVASAQLSSALTATYSDPSYTIPSYSTSDLNSAGCDPTVWNGMVTDYNNRMKARAYEQQILVNDQANRAPSANTCIQSVLSTINTAKKIYDTIMNGNLNSGILDTIAANALNLACSEINSVTGSAFNSTFGSQISELNQANGYLNGGTGVSTPLGTVSTGSLVTNSSGTAVSAANSAGATALSNTWSTVVTQWFK